MPPPPKIDKKPKGTDDSKLKKDNVPINLKNADSSKKPCLKPTASASSQTSKVNTETSSRVPMSKSTKSEGDGKKTADAKTTKKPNAAILKMKEELAKRKLEEEKLKREEEEKRKAFEEAENKRLEAIRLEKEAKRERRQKEKEKIHELKKQGKYMTKEQLENYARVMQLVESQKLTHSDRTKVTGEKRRNQNKITKESSEEASSDKSLVNSESKTQTEVHCVKKDEASTTLALPKKKPEMLENWEDIAHAEESESSDDSETPISSNSISPTSRRERKKSTNCQDSASVSHSADSVGVFKDGDDKSMRPPVICVMGHVDTGKTKILDKLRNTHVQDGEAGGITQQIGATYAPLLCLGERFVTFSQLCCIKDLEFSGLLIIDTPGHESFRNLRQRGSSLCDVAILVVDIISGVEAQTKESISILKARKTPFVVALNKIDRIYGWKPNSTHPFEKLIEIQNSHTQSEFDSLLQNTKISFGMCGFSVELFNRLEGLAADDIPVVPVSAHSGDGIGDLLNVLVKYATKKISYKLLMDQNEFKANVMEVKQVPGLGTTLDVILVSGTLTEGDTIVTAGMDGVIVTQVKSIMIPQSLKETRVKSQLQHYHQIATSRGIKITGRELDNAIAGFPILKAKNEEDAESLKEELTQLIQKTLKEIKVSERGVCVHASTLGSLEALLDFFRSCKIPYCHVKIGPIHKKDVSLAVALKEKDPMYAVILGFDVKVDADAQTYAQKEGITIFTADIIYHLFDKFTQYIDNYKAEKKREHAHLAVFPCTFQVIPQYVFNTKNPIIVGVKILSGSLRVGTPVCIPSKDIHSIGVVSSIELNHKVIQKGNAGEEVCIKIEPESGTQVKMYERHFDHNDILVSRITRESIDVLKQYFRDEVQNSEWNLIIALKKQLKIL